ncbi:hypothetical protein D3OALGA1CA_973 [Olavius algarvensis associated proteobacterium Delta 3]|nr:hypothetical protein D3OALGA1CA_973 [Olavius algarvensis associated proteobacterium Delta 3]CAB5130043.1 hypothetical protein D3OALGB2SA_3560 [Olavius algarvensis associated proteobacterium Delta 3]
MTDKPRCVVLPFRPEKPTDPIGRGMALHFLLGNVIILHTGFREFWFGWRVGKIFSQKNEFRTYCRDEGPDLDMVRIGNEQQICYWLYGRVAQHPDSMTATLSLKDIHAGIENTTEMALTTRDGLVSFRQRFLEWLAQCGVAFPEDRKEKVLWPERISWQGLEDVGHALEANYIFSAYQDTASLTLTTFERAVTESPHSFMSQNLLGWAKFRNGDYDGARKAFHRALDANPHSNGVMSGLMWCGVQLGNKEDACRWAARKAATRREDEDAAVEKAIALLKKHGKI